MRSTTYDKLNHLYQEFGGYVSTRKLMEEGFTNRQIAFLINENYWKKCATVIIGCCNAGMRNPLITNASKYV